MSKTLEDLYLGEIAPNEQYFYKNKNYRALEKNFIERHEAFIKKLNSEQKEELDFLLDEKNEMFSSELLQMFMGGFKLGANITLETFIFPNQT